MNRQNLIAITGKFGFLQEIINTVEWTDDGDIEVSPMTKDFLHQTPIDYQHSWSEGVNYEIERLFVIQRGAVTEVGLDYDGRYTSPDLNESCSSQGNSFLSTLVELEFDYLVHYRDGSDYKAILNILLPSSNIDIKKQWDCVLGNAREELEKKLSLV